MTTEWDAALAWFRAQLDEDERIAEANILRINGGRGEWEVDGMQVRDDRGHLIVRHTWPNEAEHITRHDPARTLREVEAKRRILARHTPHSMGGCRTCTAPHWGVMVCNHCPARWPCPDVRDLASGFSHVPDFPGILRLDSAET